MRMGCYIILLAVAQSALSATELGSTDREQSGKIGDLTAALATGDECSSGSFDGAPACALNALQARRAKASAHSKDGSSVGSVDEGGAHNTGSSGIFESAPAYQGSWSNEGRCSGDTLHELFFVMKHEDSEKIEQMVMDRTNPKSPRFRKWLSRAEVAKLTRNEVGLQALRAFLTKQGPISAIQETHDGDIVRVEAPVATWERLLNTQFSIHRHRYTSLALIRAPSYTLPQHLHAHVVGILKAVELGDPVPELDLSRNTSRMPESMSAGEFCTPDVPVCETFSELKALDPVLVSPTVLRQAYSVPAAAAPETEEAAAQSLTSQMVYASLGEHWSPSDRSVFLSTFNLSMPHMVVELDLGNSRADDFFCMSSPNDCMESNLDVQYMTAMSPFSKTGYFYMHTNTTFYEFLYRFILDVSGIEDPPHVISISYGMPEAGATKTAQSTFDLMAKKLLLQGVTILAASGDDGAASSLDRNTQFGPCWAVGVFGLQVNWPASSPYVTAVGATMGVASGHREIVCSVNATGPAAEATSEFPPLITSGGGFSQRLPRPAFQDGHHSTQARGVPDLSLAGHAYPIVIGGLWVTTDGTSASSPTLAGMISLINAQRLKAGLERVGWLNPTLYAHPEIFNDVTEGDNKCGFKQAPCCGGYEAGPGWDPTTGLGSPDFAKLAAILSTDDM